MVDEVIEMSDDQMARLADMMTDRVMNKMQSSQTIDQSGESDGSKTNGQQPIVNQPISENSNQSDGNAGGLTAESIAAAVLKTIQSNTAADNQKVFDTLWKEKYNNAVASVQGFDEYIKGEDDYGVVREERLNAIEDYEKRIVALDKLKVSFKEASAGQAGRRPIVNKKAQQKAEEAKSEYDEIEKKMNSGEYTNVQQMTNDVFAAISNELAGLQ